MTKVKVDKETQKIATELDDVFALVNSNGWKIVRQKLVDRILSLQNVAEYMDIIQTGTATKLLKEMKANARSAEILFDWLREIEGDASRAVEVKKEQPVKSWIVNMEKEEEGA